MKPQQQFVQLNSTNASLIIDCQGKTPAIIYWGKLLSKQTSTDMLTLLSTRQEAKCSLVIEAPISLSPLLGEGFTGAPGIEINNDDYAWSLGGELVDIIQADENIVRFETLDTIRKIKVIHNLSLHHDTDVLSANTQMENLSDKSLTVNSCNAPTIALTDKMNELMSFEGRWSNECQCHSRE